MNKQMAGILSAMAVTLLMSGCNSMPDVPYIERGDKTDACNTLDKKLVRVDEFTRRVEKLSLVQASSFGRTMTYPEITRSVEKPVMLRDARNRKTELLREREVLGCPPLKK